VKEIKFRAFRPKFGDDKIDVMTESFTLGNLQDKDDFNFTDGGYVSWNEFGLENKNTVLMQYTGLKDKNGKEIYEGDILIIFNHENQVQKMELICLVEFGLFGSYQAVVKIVHLWEKYNIEPLEYNKALYFLNLIGSKEYEIIGNIHQNPELLPGENK
jgi:uncharacterized phage protein (TIGR01671 family)